MFLQEKGNLITGNCQPRVLDTSGSELVGKFEEVITDNFLPHCLEQIRNTATPGESIEHRIELKGCNDFLNPREKPGFASHEA
jgi:hypothetical protein